MNWMSLNMVLNPSPPVLRRGFSYLVGMKYPNRIYIQDGEQVKHPSAPIDFHHDYEWSLFVSPSADGCTVVDYIKYGFSEDGGDLIEYLSRKHPKILKGVAFPAPEMDHAAKAGDMLF